MKQSADFEENKHQTEIQEASTPPPHTPEQSPADKTPENENGGTEVMIIKPGLYKIGDDIPAGTYSAINDGSSFSKITIKSSPEPEIEKPRIIVTARYQTNDRKFADRDNYVEAISRAGGIPIMPQDDEELAKLLRQGQTENAVQLAEKYDGLLLTGGGDVASHFFNQEHHPASGRPDETLDRAELALTLAFAEAKKPILGICRGMQIINIAMGGELIQDIPDLLGLDPKLHLDEETRHPVSIVPGSWLHGLFGTEAIVNSTHHQAVDGAAQGFTVAATHGPVIEAMEKGNILAVQFHPERLLGEGMLPLFEDFIKRCSYNSIEIIHFLNKIQINAEEDSYIDLKGATMQIIDS